MKLNVVRTRKQEIAEAALPLQEQIKELNGLRWQQTDAGACQKEIERTTAMLALTEAKFAAAIEPLFLRGKLEMELVAAGICRTFKSAEAFVERLSDDEVAMRLKEIEPKKLERLQTIVDARPEIFLY
jgi:hypothetical protein